MSFFKKLADLGDDIGRLGLGSDKNERKDEAHSSRNYEGQYQQQQYPPQGYGGQPSQQPYQGQYQQGPPPQQSQNFYPPPHQPDSSSPPSPAPYAHPPEVGPRPPPPYDAPADTRPLPPSWTYHFDDEYQRWYYVEETTGRSQWTHPAYMNDSSYVANAGVDMRGYGSPQAGYPTGGYPPYGGGHQSPGYGGQYSGYDSRHSGYGSYEGGEHKEKKSHNGMMLGAAGGLAVGALAGAVIAHELTEDDSGSEHGGRNAAYAAAPATGYAAAPMTSETNAYENNYYGAPPPGVLPTHNYEGEEIDSSDRESLREARDNYEEALEAAASSSASSSDQEELEEARQEYQEEYEEAYYDD